ncbi:MAG: hypothetical protein GEU79_13720 [Acidimicrobiia bacterium]|nr:hypothetical protein [Acidimicrobiia bacterium]
MLLSPADDLRFGIIGSTDSVVSDWSARQSLGLASLGIRREDATFGNRYDDPNGQYRVLYASSERIGTFLETLARFRPEPAILAEPIASDPTDELYPTNAPGVIPAAWLRKRAMGTATVAGQFADVGPAAPSYISAAGLPHV